MGKRHMTISGEDKQRRTISSIRGAIWVLSIICCSYTATEARDGNAFYPRTTVQQTGAFSVCLTIGQRALMSAADSTAFGHSHVDVGGCSRWGVRQHHLKPKSRYLFVFLNRHPSERSIVRSKSLIKRLGQRFLGSFNRHPDGSLSWPLFPSSIPFHMSDGGQVEPANCASF